jgi:hypothetical protein
VVLGGHESRHHLFTDMRVSHCTWEETVVSSEHNDRLSWYICQTPACLVTYFVDVTGPFLSDMCIRWQGCWSMKCNKQLYHLSWELSRRYNVFYILNLYESIIRKFWRYLSGNSEAVNRRWTTQWPKKDKTLHKKLKTEQHEPHKNWVHPWFLESTDATGWQ